MNLQTHIKASLWQAIQSTYEAGNYSHAILDAMHYLSNVLRDKTGADGDGVSLAGQAMGGESPRLRINKLQTDTERNEQRGIESIIRGMYQAIRNPRSHEQIEDNQDTANVIIYFINYILGIIERSEEPYSLSKFMVRVFDPDFYRSQRYAELLIDEIPLNKRFDTLVTVYREKEKGEIYNIGLFVRALIEKLTSDNLKDYLSIVSDELSSVTDESIIRYNLNLLPSGLWGQLSEISRLRIENRIIHSIKEGEVQGGKCAKGGLATWARNHFQHFTLRRQLCNELMNKIRSGSQAAQHYSVKYYLSYLPQVVLNPIMQKSFVETISNAVRREDNLIREALVESILTLPEDWQKGFIDELKDLTDEEDPEVYLSDGTPFLKNRYVSLDEEDTPF